MKVIGLTGGVGMGKSASARLLGERGFPVADTDKLAREVVEPGQPGLQEIKTVFGAEMVDERGRLRRDALARIVFAQPARRKDLEAILHPLIRERWLSLVEHWRNEGHTAAFVVIPLLYETGARPHFDGVICVACSAATQRARLAERGWNAEETAQRIKAQWPAQQKMDLADYIIWTESSLQIHAQQLDRILATTELKIAQPPPSSSSS
jgi:dephospho-CoA kinase